MIRDGAVDKTGRNRKSKEMENWLKEFRQTLSALGIAEGDIVYISSDMSMITYQMMKYYHVRTKDEKKAFMNAFVDTLIETVGDKGTLLIPMFTWSFCRNIPYDIRTTKGEVGVLGNWILENRADFKRTKHPLYSFMTIGKDADILCEMDNRTAWGQDSPFAYLHKNHAKNLLINVTLERCFTFTHYVEETMRVPYRYMKDFHGTYVDEDGKSEQRVYTMFVRDLDIESKQVTPENCLDEAGVAKTASFLDNTLKVVDLAAAYPVVEENYLHHNGDQWYEFPDYVIDWQGGQTHPDATKI